VIDIRSLSKKAPRTEHATDDSKLRCLKGHQLVLIKGPQFISGKKVFQCARCSTKRNSSVQEVYCCHECAYYVCATCVKKDFGPPKTHMSDNLLVRDISGVSMYVNKPRLTEQFPVQEIEDPNKKPDPLEKLKEGNPLSGGCRENLYIVLFKPDLTLPGRLISNFMGLMIVLNLTVMIFKPFFCQPTEPCWKDKIWLYIEAFFAGLFTLEFVLRLLVCNAFTNKVKEVVAFFKNPSNICDLLSVLPFYFSLLADQKGAGSWALILKVVRLFRLARIMRAMRLVKILPKRYASILPPVMMIFLVIWGIYNKEVEFATKK